MSSIINIVLSFYLSLGLSNITQCQPCPGGQYCESNGLETPNGDCTEGYYCEFGMDRSEPTGGDATSEIDGTCVLTGGQTGVGDVCPLGFYCPTGTTTPLPCEAGSYSNETVLANCRTCPAGYYCLEGNIKLFLASFIYMKNFR